MDIFYYSNYCKHSQTVIQFLVKNNLTKKANFICIDKRTRDPRTNQYIIHLENGKQVPLPPNIVCVPSLLLINQQFRVVSGDEIIEYYRPLCESQNDLATKGQGEPIGYSFGGFSGGVNKAVISEHYTSYNFTPDQLGTKAAVGSRPLNGYVSASTDSFIIPTPPENYKSDRIGAGAMEDNLNKLINTRDTETPGIKPAFMNI